MAGPKRKGGAGDGGGASATQRAVAAAAKKAKQRAAGKGAEGPGNKGGNSKLGGKSKPGVGGKSAGVGQKRPRQEDSKNPPKPMSSKEKKEAARAKKLKLKPNFGTVQEITAVWEKMRPSNIPAVEKRMAVDAIMKKVEGRIATLAMSHTASRVIQACAKHGDNKVRKAILGEVKGKMLEMSKSSYGNFVVRKLITAAAPADMPELLKAFKGRIPELMRHPCGSAVVVDLYAAASTAQRNVMAAEFYGKEFQLFDATEKDSVNSLTDLMKTLTATQRKSTLQHLTIQLSPVMEKGLVDSELVHRLVWEYIQNGTDLTTADVIDNLAGPFLMRMIHTSDGAQAACAILRAGSAKDRKKIVKAMKEHVKAMAEDEHGHLVLLAALGVVDDTALLRKMICNPLQDLTKELAVHKIGRKVLLQLLSPFTNRYLHVDYHGWIRPNTAGAANASDEDGIATRAMSLKDPETRRKEVLGSGEGSLAQKIALVAADNVHDFLMSFSATDIVLQVARGGAGGLLLDAAPDAVKSVQDTIVELVGKPKSEEGSGSVDGDEEHVLLNYVSSRTLRRLVLMGQHDDLVRELVFRIWEKALSGRCKEWFGTHADKVLAVLLSCGNEAVVKAATKELKPLAAAVDGSLKSWADTHGLRSST